MFGLTPAHLIIILVIALIVVGPGKLPEVGSAIGKSIKEFQKAVGPVQEAMTGSILQSAPPAQAQAPAQPYVVVQPGYPAPVAQTPVQYQPAMGVVEPAPAQPAPVQTAPISAPQPEPVQPAPESPKAD
jgi:TatA/E family protein of Tat protein translocase